MWKGRVWTERSALRLLRRRAANFHSSPERLLDTLVVPVEGAWGGAGTPPLNFQKIEGAGEGSPPPRWRVFQRDADIRSSVVWHEYGYSSRE